MKEGLVRWFAENSVAANLLMILIIAGGILSVAFQTKMEVFPELATDIITVTVSYPGASPSEVEEGINTKIEEEVQGIEGIEKLTSSASENVGVVVIELMEDTDKDRALDDVKNRIDGIDTFPEEAEEPVVQQVVVRSQVLNVSVGGDMSEKSLKRLGEQVRDELLALDGITQAELVGTRPYEISIELSEESMRRFGVGFDMVANAVRGHSLDLPGGSLETEGGEILLRTLGQAERGPEFERIPVLTRTDGTRVLLSEVATVIDGFEDIDRFSRFNGKPAVIIQVFRVGDQSAIGISESIRKYVAEAEERYPDGVELNIFLDDSKVLESRLELLLRNGGQGLALVFVVLTLFLQFRLAIWVSMGIPISFFGTLLLMPTLDMSINLISLFAFILVLGIVVDDAIVVGENIFVQRERGKPGLEAAKDGVEEVSVPVIFAVLTTVAAFSPLMMIPGVSGQIWSIIPVVVIVTLLFSIVESQLILPAHLAHTKVKMPGDKTHWLFKPWELFQGLFVGGLDRVIRYVYKPLLDFGLEWRYLTLAVAVGTIIVTIGMVSNGFVKFVFFPPVEADNVAAMLTLPEGTNVEVTRDTVRQIEDAINRVQEQHMKTPEGEKFIVNVLTSIGDQPFRTIQESNGPGGSQNSYEAAHLGEVLLELTPSEERNISSNRIADLWRKAVGSIPDAEVTYTADLFSPGEPINFLLASPNLQHLEEAAERLKDELRTHPGVYDITDSFKQGKQEVKFGLKENAQNYGLDVATLARQVRQGFYGEEAQSIQRGRDEVKVMVRYPKEQRTSLGDLENLRIRGMQNQEIPLGEVAETTIGRGFSTIQRTDRKRSINVLADVNNSENNANDIVSKILNEGFMENLLADYPGMIYTLEGQQKEQADTFSALGQGGFLALLVIYALLAVPFKSYTQPLIVMSAIPFGLVGAVAGHVIMGMELSMLSMCGIVALAGVVVNDSLVLVDFINRKRLDYANLHNAVLDAGIQRFRPIMLTSMTTFVGLLPMLLEKSVQAKFLIPMAVSLGFGVMFSTFITLGLVPAGYLILEDFQKMFGKVSSGIAWVYSDDEKPKEAHL